VVRGDLVFFALGKGRGGALLRQTADGAGVKVEAVYPLNPELGNRQGGVVLVGDYLYGDSEDSGNLFCAELTTGAVRWRKRAGVGATATAYADGRVYLRCGDGTMVLAEASPDDYKPVGSFKVPHSGERPSWAHPVVAGGRLYLREGDYLLCYDLRPK
jgi:outer membrane protein assembly factor BamB